jgi:molecular chaperone DnaK
LVPKEIILESKCATPEEFAERFAARACPEGFLVECPKGLEPGREVRLEARLADGRPVLKGRGMLARSSGNDEFGTVIRFLVMDPVSRALLLRMIQRRRQEQAKTGGADVPQPGLDSSLRRMVMLSDEKGGGATKPARRLGRTDPVIGIDLGTSNSCCALVREGRPMVIPSRRGHNTVPSVVAMNAFGELVVGQAAKAQMELAPERTIYGSKRLVGRPFDSPVVRQVRDRFHYRVVEGPNHEAAVQIGAKRLTLEEVSAAILEELKGIAQEYLGRKVERAVITVPAYYNENQRLAVRRAGDLAGLFVERIINEPTAAALTYGHNRGMEQRILIYDLGGGTFDASILNLYGNVYEVVATGGDTFLGGLDFDTQLADHVLIDFQLQLGRLPQMERVAFLRVLQAAEHAKCQLSQASETVVQLPYIGKLEGKPVELQVKVTRGQFEELVTPLLKRTLQVCDSVLRQAKMTVKDLDNILLVGGQTRMPLVWQMVRQHFGKEPCKGVHPDESVATGAALMAESLDKLDAVVLIDVLPISIGVGVPGGAFRKVVPAGAALPASRSFGLYTYRDDQTEMHLPVFQGESPRVNDNEYLGTVHLRGIPPGPAFSKMIEVTFSLSPECLLTVAIRDREGTSFSEAVMSTQDTPETLCAKLNLGEPEPWVDPDSDLKAQAVAEKVVPAAAPKASPAAELAEPDPIAAPKPPAPRAPAPAAPKTPIKPASARPASNPRLRPPEPVKPDDPPKDGWLKGFFKRKG